MDISYVLPPGAPYREGKRRVPPGKGNNRIAQPIRGLTAAAAFLRWTHHFVGSAS
jgi:hypothetical protein